MSQLSESKINQKSPSGGIGGAGENPFISTHEGNFEVTQKEQTGVSTSKYAAGKGVKPESVRARVYRFGDYFGDVPLKGQNGRLLWPATNTNQQQK